MENSQFLIPLSAEYLRRCRPEFQQLRKERTFLGSGLRRRLAILLRLHCRLPAPPVSYTHLDVYKRQAFLEENPKDQITEEQAYQNSTLLYLNTVASLTSWWWSCVRSRAWNRRTPSWKSNCYDLFITLFPAQNISSPFLCFWLCKGVFRGASPELVHTPLGCGFGFWVSKSDARLLLWTHFLSCFRRSAWMSFFCPCPGVSPQRCCARSYQKEVVAQSYPIQPVIKL